MGRRASRFALALALVLVLGGCGSPAPPPVLDYTVRELSPRMVDLRVASPAVGWEVPVRILLPEGFAAEPGRTWPVLYLLHGCCDSYDSWTRFSDVEELSADDDVLVVMPDGGASGWYSDWRDGPGWETFHLTELRRILVEDFRAGRAESIGGLSMGGLGALGYAARHPGRFRSAASLSGVVRPRHEPSRVLGVVESEPVPGLAPEDLWGDPVADAAVWREHDPYDMAESLRGTELFLYCGSGAAGDLDPVGTGRDPTETSLHRDNVSLVGRLESLGITAEVNVGGPGTHTGPYWARELRRIWPALMASLHAPG